jgi:hypothetical protein
MPDDRPIVTKEAFYDVALDMARESYRDLEEQMLSLGVMVPEKVKMLIRGALFRHSIKMSVIHVNQALGKFDFSEILKLTEPDLIEWFVRQEGATLDPLDPSRN